MAQLQYSKIREQGVTFVIVVVKDHVINCKPDNDNAVSVWAREFGCPAVLYGARQHRTYGRRDLSQFVANLHYSQIPWKTMVV